MALSVSKSFTAVGQRSDGLLVNHGDAFSFTSSGTYSGSIVLERTQNGGQSYQSVAGPFTTDQTAVRVEVSTPDQKPALYSLRCSAYTSGTIVTTLNELNKVLVEYLDANGASIFKVDEAGITITGTTTNSGAITNSGAASFTGNVTLGDAIGDDIAILGALASDIIPKTDVTYTIGSLTKRMGEIYCPIFKTGTTALTIQTNSISAITTDATTAAVTLQGTTTNDSAAAGKVGEVASASRLRSAATGATTATSLNVTAAALSLTAGDWDVSGYIGFLPAATTSITVLKAAISKTTATLPASDTFGVQTSGELGTQFSTAANVPGANDILLPLVGCRISLTATTNIFLVANATFTVSTLTVYGSLCARRVR